MSRFREPQSKLRRHRTVFHSRLHVNTIATLNESEPPVASGDIDPVFDRDKFLLRQKATRNQGKVFT
jgi:hypothetical protein